MTRRAPQIAGYGLAKRIGACLWSAPKVSPAWVIFGSFYGLQALRLLKSALSLVDASDARTLPLYARERNRNHT